MRFVKNQFFVLSLVFIIIFGMNQISLAQDVVESRPFLLGFTYQPHDWSAQAFEETYAFIQKNSDMVFYYFDDGVPWPESFAHSHFHENVEMVLNDRVAHIGENQKVAVGVNFLAKDRRSLAGYWGEVDSLPRSGEWASRGIAHPDVIAAYVSYCRELITHFNPKYFVYGMEIDAVDWDVDNQDFLALEKMVSTVYTQLRREFVDLPLLLTFVLAPEEDMQKRKKVVQRFLPYTDIYAVSFYPYLFDGIGGNADKIPADLLSRVRSYIGDKPFAVAETGFNAKTWRLLTRLIWIPGTEQSQATYVDFLLREAHKLDARFVNWWVPRDLDGLWEKMEDAGADPMFSQWNSNGLVDAEGEPRKGLSVWRTWHNKRVVP